MKVFKFGGASVNSVDRIRKIPGILRLYPGDKIMVIVSAMGKTTNALEEVVAAFFSGNSEDAIHLFGEIKKLHLAIAKELLGDDFEKCRVRLEPIFTEAEWLLHERPVRSYDYYYDQLVCVGELLSTSIVSAGMEKAGLANAWIDVRDIFRTDNEFRNASIDWDVTQNNIHDRVKPMFENVDWVVTQGFIGATGENESTTLGREGSDYSAAVFANHLDAEHVTIWKDVRAVMNADPKQFASAREIPRLDFHEVIEMAYYGAQVIHPKTIKPLQNKNIPLYVKSFIDPSLPGTVIHDQAHTELPSIIVLKQNQVMLEMSSRDFSFIGETLTGQIYALFAETHISPNLTQNGAISFTAVLDDRKEKIEEFALRASAFLDVHIIRDLSLLTIRHYQKEEIDTLTKGKTVILRQQTPHTIQMLLA